MTIALWVVAVILIAVGVIGTVLPALPGVILVFAGVALGAWIDDFTRISGWTLLVLGILTLLVWAIDYFAAAAGAKKAGASRQALIGATIGTVVGVFTGLVGLIFMPLVGAAVGEYLAQRDLIRAGRVGFATWLGLLAGTVLKVAVVFLMVGIFVAALLIE
jgi:uncharacterized protein YqgC (DUF456 family)